MIVRFINVLFIDPLAPPPHPIKYPETAKHILIARYTNVVALVSEAPCATRPRIR